MCSLFLHQGRELVLYLSILRGHVLDVPSSVPLLPPAVGRSGGTCQASSTDSFMFTWPTVIRHHHPVDRAPLPVSWSVPRSALLNVPLCSCGSCRLDGCHAGGWHAVHEAVRLATFCFVFASSGTSSANLFRKFALFKGTLCTHA